MCRQRTEGVLSMSATVDFKLSNVLLRVDEHAAQHPELYYRCAPGEARYDEERRALALDGPADFLTYVNACSACKWRQYAELDEVWLGLSLQGKGQLRVVAVASGSDDPAVLQTVPFDFASSERLDVRIPTAGADLVAFRVEPVANGRVEVSRAHYYAKVVPDEVNEVTLALSTTTFRKEEFIVPNIALVKEGIAAEGEPLASHFHMFVVDNGQTLDAGLLSDSMVTVIPNRNVGGSGGFARGMIAAQDAEADFTHVLLMDDDVRIMPESLIRTFNLLSLAHGSYKDAFVNGAMLSLENPVRQFEDVAVVRRSGGYCRIKEDLDVSRLSDIVQNERMSVELPRAYGAWWFSCIPMRSIRENGLPMPFFVRCDDVEFGARNKGVYMTMNGICVWHASFEGRFRASVDCYQFTRNFLAMMAVDDCSCERLFMARTFSSVRRYLRDMDYAAAEMTLDGLEDYLKGPDFLAQADGAALMKANGAKNEKTEGVESFDASLLAEAGVTDEVLGSVDFASPGSFLSRALKALPYDKHYLPRFALNDKPAYVVKDGATTLEGSSFCRSTLVCLDPTRTQASVRRMDKERFKVIRRRTARLRKRYREDGGRVRAAYKEAFPYLTSREFWEEYLGR